MSNIIKRHLKTKKLTKRKSIPYYVYILKCNDNTLYIGSTNNIEKRLHAHNNLKSGAHYTKIRRPVTMIYSKKYKDMGSARSVEAILKKLSRKEKDELVRAYKLIK